MRVTRDDLRHFRCSALIDGAFDPLHAGHLAYIKAAKREFGSLVCAVASDDDIRAKGREPLLPQEQRVAIMGSLQGVIAAYPKTEPTEDLLEALKPTAYIKGPDWRGKLPQAQIDVCERLNIPIVYTDSPSESSSALLSKWALAQADRGLDGLEAWIAKQTVTPSERYDTAYFTDDWRTTAPPYTLDGRRKAEGRHPKIIKELFDGWTVLDVGCGPGFLVQMLRELGMDAGGIDPSADAVALSPVQGRVIQGDVSQMPSKIAHLAICREVIEHVTVREAVALVGQLFRVARRAVYITTRFHPSPSSVFDVTDERDVDPTHQTLMTQPLLRAICVLAGGRRNRDWEATLDHQGKGRVLVYEV